MIQIETLVIEEFRGIRRLRLDFAKKNFAICGPNGTGKSGVIDALEFALTGNITRLTGQGTSGISLKLHAPHVDRRDTPDKARVILTVFIPSLNKSVVIERFVTTPSVPKITPTGVDITAVIAELERHPEFALSRREIIKYVITPPGERSKEVQALLRLDQVERVRQSLQTVVNSANTEVKRFDDEVTRAQFQLVQALGLAQLRKEDVLTAVNGRRAALGLDPLTDLTRDTSPKAGLAAGAHEVKVAISRKQALKDVDLLIEISWASVSGPVESSRSAVVAILRKLLDNSSLLRNFAKLNFFRAGLDLIENDGCPFCEAAWDAGELRRHVEAKLAEAAEAATLKNPLERAARPLNNALLELESLLRALSAQAKQLTPPIGLPTIENWGEQLHQTQMHLGNIAHIHETLSAISEGWCRIPTDLPEVLSVLKSGFEALPESSARDEARDFLTICSERMDVYRAGRRNQDLATKRAALAQKVQSAYSSSSNAVLTKIYKDVEQDFSRYYSFINREDESTFEGHLTPSLGKLGFDVNFYGRGFFPPGAYHSEGHQDGMGLCLYLALMKHILGQNFTFAILDDVLMSIDSGHRREVCSLLKTEFPKTQFVITTHDPIWLQHMKSERLITTKSSLHFRKWTIDLGPVVWDDTEVWQEISKDLDNNDVQDASVTLRRYLEYISAHISERLRASIEFHSNAQYELGELLPAVARTWNSLLAQAKQSAQSWNKKTELAALNDRQQQFAERLNHSQIEQWAINKSIHYNEWANLSKEDFLPVANAFKVLLDCFRCQGCGVFFYVTPPKGQPEAIRCDCGSLNCNLKKKAS